MEDQSIDYFKTSLRPPSVPPMVARNIRRKTFILRDQSNSPSFPNISPSNVILNNRMPVMSTFSDSCHFNK
jgi:hypothetical protein